MASALGKFTLRSDFDSANPWAARLYGEGLTPGQNYYYVNNAVGNRTAFLSVLCQGARGPGDLPCDGIERVYYAGFELPEFDAGGQRNWRYHSGKVPTLSYIPVTAVNAGTDTLTIPSHGFADGDPIAFWGRGTDAVLPSPLAKNVKYRVSRIDADNIKVQDYLSSGLIDLADAGTHLDRIFAYRADTFYFDPEQGRPEFFPSLDFTFAGLTYIEVLLPTNLSTGTDEPTNLKVILRGKQMHGLKTTSGVLDFDTSVITAEPNNALIAVDAAVNDGHMAFSRFHPTTFLAWRDRCDGLIPWAGGGDAPAPRATWNATNGLSYSATDNVLTRASGTDWTATVSTEQFTAPYGSCEARYTGTPLFLAFAITQDTGLNGKQGLLVQNGTLYYLYLGATYEIMAVGSGDKLKIVYENNGFFIYRNGIPLPAVQSSYTQAYASYYVTIGVGDAGTVDNILVAPSGTNSLPRQIKRFQGGYVAPSSVAISDLFEAEVALSCCSWADVDGQIRIATDPDRTPCFTFSPSNTASITVKRKDPDQRYNFYTFVFRDADDPILAKKFVPVDRDTLRAANGNRLISAGVRELGVMPQSQAERYSEAVVRTESDLDIDFTIEAFGDSLNVCKGSYVNVWGPETGYTSGAPALCTVINENIQLADVETRSFDVQIITPDWYSDTAHGRISPIYSGTPFADYTPPPSATALTLTESIQVLPDNTEVSAIEGLLTFGAGVGGNQEARIDQKILTNELLGVTLNNTTDVITKGGADTWPTGSTPVSLVSYNNNEPAGSDQDSPYYLVNVSGNTAKLSKTIGGSPVNFTTNGAQLHLYSYVDWQETGIVVYPNSSNQAPFEIIPARKSLTLVRAYTRSAVGVGLSTIQALHKALLLVGDTTVPDPPTLLTATFDGININWTWAKSVSTNVNGYQLTDENGFIVRDFTPALGYSESASALSVTRRVYAVSRSGVRSSTYASLAFIVPPTLNWIDVTGAGVTARGTLKKTAGDGWNTGASLSRGILSPDADVYLKSGKITQLATWTFGLSYDAAYGAPYITNTNQFYYGVQLNGDGTFDVRYWDTSGNTPQVATGVGAYDIGDELYIKIAAPTSPTGVPTLTIWQIRDFTVKHVGTVRQENQVHSFPSTPYTTFPVYAGVAIYSNSAEIPDTLSLSGIHIPNVPIHPLWQDVAHATISGDLTTFTANDNANAGSGWSVDYVQPDQDGIFSFTVGTGFVGDVGICTTALAASVANMPLLVHIAAGGAGTVCIGGQNSSSSASLGTVGASDVLSISRESLRYIVRKNGVPIYLLPAVSLTSTAEMHLAIITASTGQNGKTVNALNLQKASLTIIDNAGKNSKVTTSVQASYMGVQSSYAVPPIKFTAPTYGQFVVIGNDGSLINSSASPGAVTVDPASQSFLSVSGSGIRADKIQLTHQADVATGTLFYRKTAGTGSPEVQTLATLKTDLGLTNTNSGDITLTGAASYLSLAGQAITQNAIDVSTSNITGILASTSFPALSGDITTSAGSLATSIGAGKVTFAMFHTAAWSDDTTLAANSSTVLPTMHAVKTYVDNQVSGLTFKQDAKVATTANITLSGTQTIDGIAVIAGDRVLVKNQTTGSQNGVYDVAAGAWARSSDTDTAPELVGATIPVTQGTVNQDTWWTVTNDTITLGTTVIVFTQIGGAGTYSAGAGLTLSGNSFAITTGGITTAMVGDSQITLAKQANVNTSTVFYRKTSGAGIPEVQSFTTLRNDVWARASIKRLKEDYLDVGSTFAQALIDISSTPTKLEVSTQVVFSSNTSIQAAAMIDFVGVGSFSANTGVTVTINSPFPWIVDGGRQVFFGNGNIVFGKNATGGRVHLSLWNGAGTGSDDNHAIAQATASFAPNPPSTSYGGIIYFGSAIYYIDNQPIYSYIHWRGAGKNLDPESSQHEGTLFRPSNTSSSNPLVYISGNFRDCSLEDLTLSALNSTTVKCLSINGVSGNSGLGALVKNVSVHSNLANSGVTVTTTDGVTSETIHALIQIDGSYLQSEIVHVKFDNCTSVIGGASTDVMWIRTSNSNIHVVNPSWTVSTNGNIYDIEAVGWLGIEQGDERGNAPSYSLGYTADGTRPIVGNFNASTRTLTITNGYLFTEADSGHNVSGVGLPANNWITAVTSATTCIIDGAGSYSTQTGQNYTINFGAQSGSIAGAVLKVRGTHGTIWYKGGCDEGFKYFLFYKAAQFGGSINIESRQIQSLCHFESGLGLVKFNDCHLFDSAFDDAGSCRIFVNNCHVEKRSLANYTSDIKASNRFVAKPSLWYKKGGSSLVTHVAHYDDYRLYSGNPQNFGSYTAWGLGNGVEFSRVVHETPVGSRHVVPLGTADIFAPSASTGSVDASLYGTSPIHDFMVPSSGKYLARWGVCDSATYAFQHGWAWMRASSDGWCVWDFTQAGVGVRLNAPITASGDIVTAGKLTTTGSVGIGYATPTYKLQIDDGGGVRQINIGNIATGVSQGVATKFTHEFGRDASGYFSIKCLQAENPGTFKAAFEFINASNVVCIHADSDGIQGTWNGAVISLAKGGTGQTTANGAFNALAPAQSGNSGKVLTTDGNNTSWITIPTPANVTDGDKGQITVSGGVWAIDPGTVTFSQFATAAWSDDTTLAADSSTTLPTMHAVKTYVDSQITGLKFKVDVLAATTGNISLAGSQTIDGVSVTAGDRVLVKNQSSSSQNGVYVVSFGSWTRATDSDTGPELVSATYPVRGGTNNADTWWTVTNDTITIGSTSILFTQTGGSGSYTAGSGITLIGNSFSIATGAITNAMLNGSIAASKLIGTDITTVGTLTAGTWSANAIGPIYGGTGLNSYLTGDTLYANATNTLARLRGNSTATKKFKSMVSSTPAWDLITAKDVNWTISVSNTTPVTVTASDGGTWYILTAGSQQTLNLPSQSLIADGFRIRVTPTGATCVFSIPGSDTFYFPFYHQSVFVFDFNNQLGGTSYPVGRGMTVELTYSASTGLWLFTQGFLLV